jgi:hypothetical protein
MKHKHAELIKAWADGAEIQCFHEHYGIWQDIVSPPYWIDGVQYRIKPEEKQPVVRWLWASKIGDEWHCQRTFLTDAEAVKHLNYSYLVTKLEFTRQEFPE